MLCGYNFIGFERSSAGGKKLQAFSTVQGNHLPEAFFIATENETESAVQKAAAAFEQYKKTTAEERALFLETIAGEIMALGDALIQRAMLETGLPDARLLGERGRTVGQLQLFAGLLREGSFVEAIIDTALPQRKPVPRPDLRRMLQPIGPVAVFAASNFPLAFSTAGGDTASALAAGCPVVIKAHSSHLGTNELVAGAIVWAAQKCGMPDGVFSSLIGEGAELGQALARHPVIKAIGFTGSFKGGMALYKTASERDEPIPVYAEMSSINPVLLLPQKLTEDVGATAAQMAGSICLGVGQFCTNPGLLFVLNDSATDNFIQQLSQQLAAVPNAVMLNKTICNSYYKSREVLLGQEGVQPLHTGGNDEHSFKGSALLAQVAARHFIKNKTLQQEVFGPASLVVRCTDEDELASALQSLDGQLTATVIGTERDIANFKKCIEVLQSKVGRLVFNGVPTGVEVSHAMVHGGPFPATTDSRSTSVGTEAIKRFLRPVCFQSCPDVFLPLALQNNNPLNIFRKVNGTLTQEPVVEEQTTLV